MSYALFLVVFLVFPILGLWSLVRSRLRLFHLIAGRLVCLIAFVYTTPWDNYAAQQGLWHFSSEFVWGKPYWLGYLPLEEYLFYLLETAFVCFTLIALSRLRWLAPDSDMADGTAQVVEEGRP